MFSPKTQLNIVHPFVFKGNVFLKVFLKYEKGFILSLLQSCQLYICVRGFIMFFEIFCSVLKCVPVTLDFNSFKEFLIKNVMFWIRNQKCVPVSIVNEAIMFREQNILNT